MSHGTVERAACEPGLRVAMPAGATGLATYGIDIRGYRAGSVRIPDGWVAADLSFLAAEGDPTAELRGSKTPADLATPPAPVYKPIRRDAASSPLLLVTNILTTGAAWYPLPANLFLHGFIKPKSTNTASEAAVNQTGSPVLLFSFRS